MRRMRHFDVPAACPGAPAVVQERQELIQQWENALAQMRRTDDAINVASELFAEKRSALREKQRRLDISAQFLDDQLQTNRDCEGLIAALGRDLAALRSQYATEQARARPHPQRA